MALALHTRLAPLAHRNYRLMWIGTLVSNTGDWMDQIALNWLVLNLNGNPMNLAALNLLRALPILGLTLVGGAVADRVDRRRMLICTQSLHMASALVLWGLAVSGHASLAPVLVVALLRGVNIAFNLPARHALLPLLVPKDLLPSAVALNAMTINLTKVLGPLIAGGLIAVSGPALCFALNGLSFLVVLWTLTRLRFDLGTKPPALPLHRSIAEGLRHLRADRPLCTRVALAMAPPFLAQPYLALLSVFAIEVYRSGPETLGLLTATASLGAISGAALLVARPDLAQAATTPPRLLMVLGISLAGFALTPQMVPALPLLFATGALTIAANTTLTTQIQLGAPEALRGRILSVMLLNRGIAQIGTAVWAGLASVIGVETALTLAGVLIVGIGWTARAHITDGSTSTLH